MHDATVFFATIGGIGIASQWVAWRTRLPAIIFLLAAGLVVGPVTGLIAPTHLLGALARPMIGIAVAIILVEGGLTLDLAGLRDASQGVRRICFVAAPAMALLTILAAHALAGLSWATASVAGGILVVTGPTVVIPLLRQARLTPRPASVLRWEAIVNDAVGALFAVVAFEIFAQLARGGPLAYTALFLSAAIAGAALLGFLLGRGVALSYRTTWVPEYLKAPGLFALVILGLVAGNAMVDEAGLLTVTVMGITIANSRIASLGEIRRFKEHAAILLVSGVFVLLTADIQPSLFHFLDPGTVMFTVALIFVIRPAIVAAVMVGSNLTWRERVLVGLIAPRGVVAVAAAGIFSAALLSIGIADGNKLMAIVFLIVFVTVIMNSIAVAPLARFLNLASEAQMGVLLVGANPWTLALAEALKDMETPVMIADRNWRLLAAVRNAKIETYYGEILSEAATHDLDTARFGYLIAATDNDAYNMLVCTDFAPTFGRQHVFQIGRAKSQEDNPKDIAVTVGGRTLLKSGLDYDDLQAKIAHGWAFRKTKLTEEYDFDTYYRDLSGDAELIFAMKSTGELVFATVNSGGLPRPGDTVIGFAPRTKPA